jgi:hypothetical protein
MADALIERRMVVAVNPRRFGESDSMTTTNYRMRRASTDQSIHPGLCLGE